MASFLDQIVEHQRQVVAAARRQQPLAALAALAAARCDYRGFEAALRQPGVRVIAEIKRASPSKGALNLDLDPVALAGDYEAGGAVALSVLTEEKFFRGSAADLRAARAATRLPVLRKDFIIDEYQVYEAAAWGADAVLLIVRILDDAELLALHRLARRLGLDVLVEVHDEADVRRIASLAEVTLVGINNRNLASFETDVRAAHRIARMLGPHQHPVAASAIAGPADVAAARAAGIRAFLIGESLVRAPDAVALLRQLVAVPGQLQIKVCGLTDPEQARACAEAGADAIGFVFYPRSPRHLSLEKARSVRAALPAGVAAIGVFVDAPEAEILEAVRQVGLDAVQLHGRETPELVARLSAAGVRVVMTLRTAGSLAADAGRFSQAPAFLVECAPAGELPGGNGQAWDWTGARVLASGSTPFALAGGLNPGNVVAAILAAQPSAVDVSSGVEAAPGVKDLEKVRQFIQAVRRTVPSWSVARVF